MLRSSTPPPPVGDTTQLRHQNDSQDNSKDRSTSDSAEKTTAAATEPPPEDAIVENVENPATMTEKTSALAITVISSPDQRDLSKLIEMEDKFDDGYDSDGAIGPFWECLEEEGLQDYDEEEMTEVASTTEVLPDEQETENACTSEPDREEKEECMAEVLEPKPPPMVHLPIETDVLKGMKVPELKLELKKRGQPVGGNKSVLQRRLEVALSKKLPVINNGETTSKKKFLAKKKTATGISAFAEGAYWKVLTPKDELVEEPLNATFRNPRAPTIEERDAQLVPMKHDFDIKIDRPPFLGTVDKVVMTKGRRGSVLKKETKNVERRKGCVDPKFVEKYGLDKNTTPSAYMDLIFPYKKNVIDGKEMLSFEQLMRWTNMKAHLSGAGKGGVQYRDFKDFTIEELRQHVGIYILHGLSPSPRLEYKMKPQGHDKIHGNDFVYRSLGQNAERRHRHFKAFFSCQNPAIEPPDRKKFPNWKVRPIIKWMNYIFPVTWMLGIAFSIDEMTMGFKGKHVDKRRITYKAEGDGFQGDALCQDGFTYQVYMRNHPAPKEYLRLGLSPLHARVMALFDSVKDSHHQCAMDNLYNSAAFCKAAVNHKRKVLCHGVTRKGARGIPPSVVQEEVKDRKKQIDVRGTVKAALLEGDPNCVGLVASSVYDTKPVHYLSMVCEELKWLEVEKQVYNVDTGKVESLRFLRMNTIDNYNKTMGNVDIADQLRGSYRVDHWIRNRKWWWSLWFWSLGVMLTNAYIMKCKVDMECGVDEKDLMSQHDFRKDVAEAWINPAEYAKEKGLKMTVTTNRKRKTITDADSSVSSVTMSTSSSVSSRRLKTSVSLRRLFTPRPEKRATAFTDDSLSPNGQLKIRLNVAADHYPIPPSSTRARCALHRWVDNESLKQVMKCTTCNVHLCIQCYKLYHTVPDLISIKQHLKKKYDTNKDA